MRLINIEKITSDMKLARPIYGDINGKVLLNIGCTNLIRYKEKLIEMGIHYIYINDDISEDIVINDAITEQTRMKSKKIIAETTKSIVLHKAPNIETIRKAVSDIVDDILSNRNILLNLTDIKTNDDYTFAHSVNVTVISLVIGKLIGLNYLQLMNLGTGALLHDIGKSVIPESILNKPDKLTNEEFSIMQQHPKLGFDLVKNNVEIGPLIRVAILTHHEKYDGSGYPNQFKGKEIHEFGRIVAIADVFDALTSDRVYRKRWPIYQAIEYLTGLAGSQFDPDLVNIFVKNIAAFPNGVPVILSSGEKGIVKEQNKNFPTRPIVKLLLDKNGNKISKEVDLLKELSMVITESE